MSARKDSAAVVVGDSMESVWNRNSVCARRLRALGTVPIQKYSTRPFQLPGCLGYVLLLSSKTKQWAADFKLNSTATAVTFSPDSRYVLASCADANVYKFDVRSRRCVLRFFNEVCMCVCVCVCVCV